jgi:chitin disaccharide deacetylase
MIGAGGARRIVRSYRIRVRALVPMEKASPQTPQNGPDAAPAPSSRLIVTADDYGYAGAYDAGILEAASAGAVDAVGVMVGIGRHPDPAPLLATGVELGLHLELHRVEAERRHGLGTAPAGRRRAGRAARDAAVAELERQVAEFERLCGRPAAFVDGHRHCHAAPGLGAAIGRACAHRGLPLRSVTATHRRTLRRLGVATQDRLIGRLAENEPLPPPEIATWLQTGSGPYGVTEWMVHPGHPDSRSGSSYDAGRAEDLELVLRLARQPALVAARSTHAAALS